MGFTIPALKLWGLGQPLADALKFMLKEEFTPAHVNKFYFWLAPAMAMVPALAHHLRHPVRQRAPDLSVVV